MEQNSITGTKAENNNLIVGALILLVGIVIGGVFGGGMMSSVDDVNLQGQAIESQDQYDQNNIARNIPTDEQINARKNIKEFHYITGTSKDISTAFNFDPSQYVKTSDTGTTNQIAKSISSSLNLSQGSTNDPNFVHFVCYMTNGFGIIDYSNPGFNSYGNWWSNPSSAAGVDDCVIVGL